MSEKYIKKFGITKLHQTFRKCVSSQYAYFDILICQMSNFHKFGGKLMKIISTYYSAIYNKVNLCKHLWSSFDL